MKPCDLIVQNLYDQGHRDVKSLIKLTNYSRATIFRKLKKLRQGVPLKRKTGSGKVPSLNSTDRRRLIQFARRNETDSCSDLRLKMGAKGSPDIVRRTINKYLNQAGYFCQVPKYGA